jgi:Pentapeptide repeats (8 copies)
MRQPLGRIVMLVIAAVLLLAGVLVLPLLLHPPLSARGLQGVTSADKRIELQQVQAKLQSDERATLLQGVGGLLLVVGVVATWRQVQVSREAQITERFARAIDHLGNDKKEVRLGGIYTLERIAKDSPADRPAVAAILAALVRTHAPWPVGTPSGPEHPSPMVDRQLPPLDHRAVDVSTAIVVLGRPPVSWDPSWDPPQLYLSRVDLRGAYLPGSRLSNALLRNTNFAFSWMQGIHLDGSVLDGTDLRGADLRDAHLINASLSKAHLQGADLRGADLRRADLRGANLLDARLEGADLTDARVDDTTVWPEGSQPPGLRGQASGPT